MKFNVKNFLQDKFVQGTFLLTAVGFLGSVLNFLVHPILTRHLSISEYGDFQALLSFITIFGTVGAVISTTLIKEFSILATDRLHEVRSLQRRMIAGLFVLGGLIFLIIILFNDYFNALFNIGEPSIIIIASLCLLYSFPLIVNRAVLTGLQRFPSLSFSNFLDSLSRLSIIVLFVMILPWRLIGAAWAIGGTSLLAFIYSFWQIRKMQLPVVAQKSDVTWQKLLRYTFLVMWSSLLFQFFFNFDMLFVKSIFSAEEAGLYGALLTIGRIVFFIGGSVPLVMFPVIAGLKNDSSPRKYMVLAKSLGLLAGLAVPTALFISIFPKLVIQIIVGAKYLILAPYLSVFVWIIFFLTVISVVMQYFLALSHKFGLLILTLGACVEIICLSLFHGSMWQIVWSLFASMGFISLISLYVCFNDFFLKRKVYVGK